jgi:hypothetical protein
MASPVGNSIAILMPRKRDFKGADTESGPAREAWRPPPNEAARAQPKPPGMPNPEPVFPSTDGY